MIGIMCSDCGSAWHQGVAFSYKTNVSGALPEATVVNDYTALLSGSSWVTSAGAKAARSPAFVTYSFPTKITAYTKEYYGKDPDARRTWRPFSEDDEKEARAALKKWTEASGITFLETKKDSGDIRFSWIAMNSQFGAVGSHPANYLPDPKQPKYFLSFYDYSGDMHFNANNERFAVDPAFKLHVLLHEIGHAIGLKHSFDPYEANNKVLSERYDNTSYTVMSYTHLGDVTPTKLGRLDIEAAQALYGTPKMARGHLSKWS